MAEEYMDAETISEGGKIKKRRRWPFLLLGFFLGFITLPAIIAIVVAIVINRPVGKTVSSIDKMTHAGLYETLFGNGEDLGILDGRYGDMKLTDMINDISSIASKGDQLTFNDLASVSPQVEKSIDDLVKSAKDKSIILEKTELMSTPLCEFSDLLMEEVKEVQLGEVLLSFKADIFDDPNTGAILKNLFFGRAGVNYTEINGVPEMLPLTYTYDTVSNSFTCVDETVYTMNGAFWTAENGSYVAPLNESFAVYSASGDMLYQLQASGARTLATFNAVRVNADGVVETVKQASLALGAFMDGGDPMSVIGKLELGVLLGIHLEENAILDDNKMLVALAYGTYGVDYTFEDGKVVPINGSACTTLGDLMNSPEDVLNGVELGALLGITTRADAEKDGNEMLVALAYGTYGTDYDYDAGGNIVPIGGKEFTTLGGLINSPDEVLNGVQLGAMLGITTRADAEKDGNEMLVALAYGTYGTDFDYDAGGNIVPIGGKEFTTLGSLINNPDDVLNGVQLGAMLGITTRADAEKDGNEMLVALAYGTYGTDFDYDANDNIVPIGGKEFTTLGGLINNPNDVINGVQLGSLLGITTRADAEKDGNEMLVALAYGTYGTDYDYDANDNIVPIGGKEFTTLGSLINSPDEVLDGIQIGTLLGITTRADVESNDALIVSLAYGTYGTDFDYDANDNIIPIGSKQFTTIAMLTDSTEISKILDAIPLSSIFTVDILDDEEDDALTVSLIYGTKGTHYNIHITGGVKSIEWLPNPETPDPDDTYGVRTFGSLRGGDLTDIVNDLKVGDIFELTSSSPKLLYAIQDWTVADLSNNDKINSLQLKDVIDVGTTGILAEMGDWSIGEINEDKIKSIKLSSVLDVHAGDTGMVASLANKVDSEGNPWTIGHLTEENVKNLTVGEILPDAIGADADTDFFAALKDTKIGDLDADYIKEQLTIGQVLGIKSTDGGILAKFADYKVGDFGEAALKAELTIGDVVNPNAHPILKALENTTLDNVNNSAIQNALNGLLIADVITIDDTSHPLFVYMKEQNKTLGEINAAFIDGIMVKDALGIESTTDPILSQIMDLTLGDLKDASILNNKIKGLKLNQLMNVNDVPVLELLGNYSLNEIDADVINSLKICDIIEGASTNFYLKHLSNSTIETLATDINNITVVQLFADTMEYDSLGNITGTWKYLLKWNWDTSVPDAPNKNYVAPDKYKVSDMAAMIENMHNNIESATLQDLHDDKLAAHLDQDTLDSQLVYKVLGVSFKSDIEALLGTTVSDADNDGAIDGMTIGDLNVIQVSQYLTFILDAIHSV